MIPDLELLPISVVIPTRNSMDKLPGHLSHHAAVFARCAEIVHCDSFSKDDTKNYLATHLKHAGLRQFDHPPGLYQSWNFAIQQCTQPFIYISTVGDQIDLAGLQQLLDLANQTEADIVISPPRYVEESGQVNQALRWPIDNLIGHQQIKTPGRVSADLVYTEAILHAPDGIMGSAASCLYRTAFLKPRPFPLGFHGVCDSVWALQYIPLARCAILPSPVSTFLLHPKTYESHGRLNAQIAILIREHLQKILPEFINQPDGSKLTPALIQTLIEFNEIGTALARENGALIELRKKWSIFWPLHPRSWSIRAQRNRSRAKASQEAAAIRQNLSQKKV